MDFRVDLTTFRGPLDLLLYLVRKHEVDVADIPIAEVTDQFLKYLDVLEQLDVDDVGDFIEMASTLLEMKSRMVLPSGDEETEEQSRDWQQHYPRLQNDLPPRKLDLGTQPIHELELWDLVSALGRILRDKQVTKPSNIVYDDTPIHVYMKRIHTKLVHERRASLSEMLEGGMHKSAMIGVFLAVLELARHHSVRTQQDELHGEIWLVPDKDFTADADFSKADSYGSRSINEDDLPSKPR